MDANVNEVLSEVLIFYEVDLIDEPVGTETLSNKVLWGIDIESKVTSEIVSSKELPNSGIAIATKADSVGVS